MPDIFISYAHVDNEKFLEAEQGWIDRFHTVLQATVDSLWGRRAEIWRDKKLSGMDELTPEIEARVKDSKLLVSVFSRGYVNSEWCAKELHLFCEAASASKPPPAGSPKRIVKVIKMPGPAGDVDFTKVPEVSELLGYKFYRIDPHSNKPFLFDPCMKDDERLREFYAKIYEVAFDIVSALQAMTGDEATGVRLTEPTGINVYLAEATHDRDREVDQLRRFLLQAGHDVLPKAPLTHTPDYAEQVAACMQQCRLSVHVVGETYGLIPEGARRSVEELQYDAAVAETRRRPGAFAYIPWLVPKSEPGDDRQRAFVAALQNDPELLISSLEDLKTAVQDALAESPAANPPPEPAAGGDGFLIYVVAAPGDLRAAEPLIAHLSGLGHTAFVPPAEGAALRKEHEENLRICDAVLIFYGTSPKSWLREKLVDLKKIFGLGRTRQFAGRGVFVADPHTIEARADCAGFDVTIVDGTGPFRPETLDDFLHGLAASRQEAV